MYVVIPLQSNHLVEHVNLLLLITFLHDEMHNVILLLKILPQWRLFVMQAPPSFANLSWLSSLTVALNEVDIRTFRGGKPVVDEWTRQDHDKASQDKP